MRVTKLGHCCLLIETDSARILTDPGEYSTLQDEVQNIDIVLITHEHQDHFHIDSLKKVLKNNSEAKIITNKSVGRLLSEEGITFAIVEENENLIEKGVLIEGFGGKHAYVFREIPQIQNTGYFINNDLFYPGDAFTNPNKPIGILALPVAGPWMKLSEALEYAITLKPIQCFPVHDAILKNPDMSYGMLKKVLEENSISFTGLTIGQEYDL